MQYQHIQKDVVTDADGDAAVSVGPVKGRLISIAYTKDGTAGYDDGVDFAITSEKTGQNLWTEQDVNNGKTVGPRQATHTPAGVALTYETDMPVHDLIRLVNENILITIADGGDTKTGRFDFIFED